MKRIVLAVAVLGTAGFLAVAPANASGGCLSLDVTVNGNAAPVNGTYCTPEAPGAPKLPGLPELPPPPVG